MTDEKEQQGDSKSENREFDQESNTQKMSEKEKGDANKKVYFEQELKRLRSSLQREGSKIKKPQRKAYTPYTFTTLEPYYNTVTQAKVIEHEPKEPKGYINRQTAIGLIDPWKDHAMDRPVPKPIDTEEDDVMNASQTTQNRKLGKSKKAQNASGSTRLPKFPAVQVPAGDLAARKLHYGDVPGLRKELKQKYGQKADRKVTEEYERTKNDFYRMELDKLDEYNARSRPLMTQTYKAYLQNNLGSKRAVKECIHDAEKALEERVATPRPGSAVSKHSKRPESAKSRSSLKSTQ